MSAELRNLPRFRELWVVFSPIEIIYVVKIGTSPLYNLPVLDVLFSCPGGHSFADNLAKLKIVTRWSRMYKMSYWPNWTLDRVTPPQ